MFWLRNKKKLNSQSYLEVWISTINRLKPNGISYHYQVDLSISVLRNVECFFRLYSNFDRTFCKQTVGNLIKRRVLRRQIWFSTLCRYPIKRTPGLKGLNMGWPIYIILKISMGYHAHEDAT